jgi:hypothetical protein
LVIKRYSPGRELAVLPEREGGARQTESKWYSPEKEPDADVWRHN